jgi:hypothetical protein
LPLHGQSLGEAGEERLTIGAHLVAPVQIPDIPATATEFS